MQPILAQTADSLAVVISILTKYTRHVRLGQLAKCFNLDVAANGDFMGAELSGV